MDTEKRIQVITTISTSLLTLATVIIGVWQFNKGQRELKERDIEQRKFEVEKMKSQASMDALAKFKEMQSKLYSETTSVVGYLTVHTDHKSDKYRQNLNRFWQLYWVELSSVETRDVEKSMVELGNLLRDLEESGFAEIQKKQPEIKVAAYKLAQSIKSSSREWSLPEGLK